MVYKSRTEHVELLILKYLNNRLNLSDKDKQYYTNLNKGYEGELLFDSFCEHLDCDSFILNDLLLTTNNTLFQIDSLIILQEAIYLFEVKNYEGDYIYESDRFYKKPNSEINDPLHQLNRSKSLLRQLLQKLGYNIGIDASVVFINPEFTLYQSPLNAPFIFPTQINRFMKKLNTIPTKLTIKHKMLADKLCSLHIENTPIRQLPSYDFNQLRKGITCINCSSFSISIDWKNCVCMQCGFKELVATAVLRSVREFKVLFPDDKMTTNRIHEWCKVVESKKRIKRILEKNFKIIGVHQWAYFE